MTGATWSIGDWTGYQGLPYTPDDTGVVWHVVGETGWRGTPPPRLARAERNRADGEFDGESYLSGRVIELGGWLVAPDIATRNTAMQRLAAVLADGAALAPMVVTEQGVSRLAYVRRSDVTDITPRTEIAAEWAMTLFAPDPRKYDSDPDGGGETVLSTGLPTAVAGLIVPMDVPADIDTGGASGNLAATNTGTAAAFPVLAILGPVTDPRVENLTTGQVLDFDIELAVDDTLVITPADGTVLLGASSRRAALTVDSDSPSSFRLAPGPNTLTFRAESSPGGATLTVTFRSAYY